MKPGKRSLGGVALPLLFEALPPRRDAGYGQWQDHLEVLDPLRDAGILAVNVPEIVNGAYRTVEPRAFAVALQARLRVPAVLNRITVHHPLPELLGWVESTAADYGIRDFVFVGGESSSAAYLGPRLSEALPPLAAATARLGGQAGVVTIPTRRRGDLDEPERLLQKQAAGARFAVSQILLESATAVRLQTDLAAAAERKGVRPMPVHWSLAPVGRPADIEFLRWLGVHVPDGFENAILGGSGLDGRLRRSRDANLEVARAILEAGETAGARPGFCVEHVMQRNIEAAVDLVADVAGLLREFPRAVAA